jgi:predicted DNA-binding protein
MTTTNPRLSITLEPNTAGVLALMAKHEHKSLSGFARELILEALERREDMALSDLAKKRDTGKNKVSSHHEAWK